MATQQGSQENGDPAFDGSNVSDLAFKALCRKYPQSKAVPGPNADADLIVETAIRSLEQSTMTRRAALGKALRALAILLFLSTVLSLTFIALVGVKRIGVNWELSLHNQTQTNWLALAVVPTLGCVTLWPAMLLCGFALVGAHSSSFATTLKRYRGVTILSIAASVFVKAVAIIAVGSQAYTRLYLDYVFMALGTICTTVLFLVRAQQVADNSRESRERWTRKVAAAKAAGKAPPRRKPAWLRVFKLGLLPAPLGLMSALAYILGVVKSGGEFAFRAILVRAKVYSLASIDFGLFTFEVMMGLQSRLLLLNFPSPTMMFIGCSITALWELGLRLFHVHRLARKRSRLLAEALLLRRKGSSSAERLALDGKLCDLDRHNEILSINGGGDMIVEYLSANAAMALVAAFADSAAFRFRSTDDGKLTPAFIFATLAAQHVPEIISDLISTFFEIRAGMRMLEYFRWQLSGGWRLLLPKILATVCTSFCVLTTMRART